MLQIKITKILVILNSIIIFLIIFNYFWQLRKLKNKIKDNISRLKYKYQKSKCSA